MNLNRNLGYGGAALLLMLALWALANGVADVAWQPARTALTHWEAAGTAPAAGSLERARASLALARALDPLNPRYVQESARVREWSAVGLPPWENETGARLEASLAGYRAAIARRPAWPYAWAGLARAKLRLLQLDGEFERAVERSGALGPWEPEVLLALTEIGLLAEPLLSEAAGARVAAATERALRQQPRKVIRLAARLGRADRLRPRLAGDEALERQLQREARRAAAGAVR
jgi:hypothetical protein